MNLFAAQVMPYLVSHSEMVSRSLCIPRIPFAMRRTSSQKKFARISDILKGPLESSDARVYICMLNSAGIRGDLCGTPMSIQRVVLV